MTHPYHDPEAPTEPTKSKHGALIRFFLSIKIPAYFLRFGVVFLVLPVAMWAGVPLISDVPDQVIAQDTSTATLAFIIGDTETAFNLLTVTASSSDASLFPNTSANLTLGGTTSQRSIRITPATGKQGSGVITLTVLDGSGLTVTSSFNITVTAPNSPPSLTGLPSYQIITPGQSAPPVSFTVSDQETTASALSVVATSSNLALVPNANITLTNVGVSRTVQISPISNKTGIAVIKLQVTDALGASRQSEFIFCVFDQASANNSYQQPKGIYVIDSTVGSTINGVAMRDGNVRDKDFVDGYLLRTDWSTLEPADGVFDFTIITNIFSKVPARQSVSLQIVSVTTPAWLLALQGITTWTAGSPSVTAPLPWDVITQERYRQMLVALGKARVDGIPLRDHPRLACLNAWIPGLNSGIRDPNQIKIGMLPSYSRANMATAVLTHLANVTANFPKTPTMIGFWTYLDLQDASYGGVTPWEQLRQSVLTVHDGIQYPRVGFWMENLAASRANAGSDPWSGTPPTSYTAPLYLSQKKTFIAYQMLGSWLRPFDPAHVGLLLNGSPEDAMDYGFNAYQCRYYEVYQTDVDYVDYTAEFQRWHDFLNALPAAPAFALSIARGAGGEVSLTTPTALGDSYELEQSSDLSLWTAMGGPATATSSVMSWTDFDAQTAPTLRRFYRVRRTLQ